MGLDWTWVNPGLPWKFRRKQELCTCSPLKILPNQIVWHPLEIASSKIKTFMEILHDLFLTPLENSTSFCYELTPRISFNISDMLRSFFNTLENPYPQHEPASLFVLEYSSIKKLWLAYIVPNSKNVFLRPNL